MYDGKILWGDNTDEEDSVKTCAYNSYKWEDPSAVVEKRHQRHRL